MLYYGNIIVLTLVDGSIEGDRGRGLTEGMNTRGKWFGSVYYIKMTAENT